MFSFWLRKLVVNVVVKLAVAALRPVPVVGTLAQIVAFAL